MKYNFTVWNTIIALLIPVVAYILIRQDADPNTIMGAGYLAAILIAGAAIDLVLQILIRNRKRLAIVEIVSLLMIIIINKLP